MSKVADSYRQEGLNELVPWEAIVTAEICFAIFQSLMGSYQPSNAAQFLSTLVLEDVFPPSRALSLVENVLVAYPAVFSANKPLEAIWKRGEGYVKDRAGTLLRIIYNDRVNELSSVA